MEKDGRFKLTTRSGIQVLFPHSIEVKLATQQASKQPTSHLICQIGSPISSAKPAANLLVALEAVWAVVHPFGTPVLMQSPCRFWQRA